MEHFFVLRVPPDVVCPCETLIALPSSEQVVATPDSEGAYRPEPVYADSPGQGVSEPPGRGPLSQSRSEARAKRGPRFNRSPDENSPVVRDLYQDLPALTTTKEAADVLGMSLSFVKKEVARGVLSSQKFGRSVRIRREDLIRYATEPIRHRGGSRAAS